MAYCVHCGNKLSDGENKCPICNIKIIDPLDTREKEIEKLFPEYIPVNEEKMNKRSVLTLLSFIFIIPMILVVVCDLAANGHIEWCIYVVGALLMIYLPVFMYICFIPNRNGMRQYLISIGTFVFTLDGLLLYIQHKTGGNWVSSFAGPIVLSVGLALICLIYLRIKRKWTKLRIAAMFLVFAGLICVLIEAIAIRTFENINSFKWSMYPLATTLLIAILFFYVDNHKVLKEQLKRKFFI